MWNNYYIANTFGHFSFMKSDGKVMKKSMVLWRTANICTHVRENMNKYIHDLCMHLQYTIWIYLERNGRYISILVCTTNIVHMTLASNFPLKCSDPFHLGEYNTENRKCEACLQWFRNKNRIPSHSYLIPF